MFQECRVTLHLPVFVHSIQACLCIKSGGFTVIAAVFGIQRGKKHWMEMLARSYDLFLSYKKICTKPKKLHSITSHIWGATNSFCSNKEPQWLYQLQQLLISLYIFCANFTGSDRFLLLDTWDGKCALFAIVCWIFQWEKFTTFGGKLMLPMVYFDTP